MYNFMLDYKLLSFIEDTAILQENAIHYPQGEILDSYSELIVANREAFFNLPIDVIFTSGDMYQCNSRKMFQDIERGVLYVYTYSEIPSDHPFAQKDYGIYSQLHAPTNNSVFRAVHDYSHYQNRLGFSTLAELKNASLWLDTLPNAAIDAALCETVLQTCYYHVNKRYAEQKAFVIPEGFCSYWEAIRKDLM
jgi:hypothetical protein